VILYHVMKRSIIKFKNVDIKYLRLYIGFGESRGRYADVAARMKAHLF